MDINRMIRRIKRDIGIYGIALPVENLDQLILEILEDTTIPVFSIYCPREEIVTLDINNLMKDGTYGRGEDCDLYILPDWLYTGGRNILYVKRIEYADDIMSRNYYPTGRGSIYNNLEDVMLANANKPIVDLSIAKITFKYEYPRKVYIYDSLVASKLRLTLACEHDKSCQSITPTSAESFYRLAVLDIKAGLYQTVKHYDGIETSYGRIELKIDDWQNARQEREDILKEWDDIYLLDAVGYEYG